MKIIYSHNRKTNENSGPDFGEIKPRGGTTVAMEAIQSWLLDTLDVGSTIVRKVGIARCSTDDNYCRKTGRELAQSRLKQTTLTVMNLVRFDPSYTVVFFEDEVGNLFEVKKSTGDTARLVRMLDDN